MELYEYRQKIYLHIILTEINIWLNYFSFAPFTHFAGPLLLLPGILNVYFGGLINI